MKDVFKFDNIIFRCLDSIQLGCYVKLLLDAHDQQEKLVLTHPKSLAYAFGLRPKKVKETLLVLEHFGLIKNFGRIPRTGGCIRIQVAEVTKALSKKIDDRLFSYESFGKFRTAILNGIKK